MSKIYIFLRHLAPWKRGSKIYYIFSSALKKGVYTATPTQHPHMMSHGATHTHTPEVTARYRKRPVYHGRVIKSKFQSSSSRCTCKPLMSLWGIEGARVYHGRAIKKRSKAVHRNLFDLFANHWCLTVWQAEQSIRSNQVQHHTKRRKSQLAKSAGPRDTSVALFIKTHAWTLIQQR